MTISGRKRFVPPLGACTCRRSKKETLSVHPMQGDEIRALLRAIDVARECQNQGSPLLKRIELGLHLLGQTRANQFVGCC
jgi:hypothetical protein